MREAFQNNKFSSKGKQTAKIPEKYLGLIIIYNNGISLQIIKIQTELIG
jgi:hypothetical protein